ncbi:MAG TPA: hypothetical protein VFU59_08980 [Candidatus Eisenbacteria bacterium]|nr:hypothetical protein [Candidatus Eisenbacteria bacterium]
MNLPSSLALPQSSLLRSRIGILILAAAALLLGGVAYFVMRAPAPAKLPTAATSPAAQALPRATTPVAAKPAVTSPVVYGPPAPDWVKRDLSVLPKPVVATAPVAGAPVAGAPSTVKTVGTAQAPTAATPAGVNPANPATTLPPAAAAAAAAAAASKVAATSAGQAATVPGAATAASTAPAVPGVNANATTDETPKVLDANTLFQREQYVYQADGRRDPFQSLIDGKYESQSGDGSLVDVGDIHLVGIMWGSSDKFALVEDSRGRGFVLRVGDPVVNGYISGISKTELQVVQNAFGDSQTVTIQLKSKEGEPNATRNQ